MLNTVAVFRGYNKTNINKEEKGEDDKEEDDDDEVVVSKITCPD